MRRYMQNLSTDATAEVFSGLLDFHKRDKRILQKKNPFVYPSSDIITALKDTVLSLYDNGTWKSFVVETDTDLGTSSLDTGTGFVVGTDYYIYLVDNGNNGLLLISANSTYPAGYTANNSRKIGGFHYGHIRCTNDQFAPIAPGGAVFGDGWKDAVVVGIIPNSVWDLHNRPLCSPEGMALVGNIWVDIYPASVAETIAFETSADRGMSFVAGGKLQSRYGVMPATGAEGLNWYSFQELAARSGKRLLSYGEWVRGAYGNPGGQDTADDYGWTKATNGYKARVGCQVNGSGVYDAASTVKRFAVSAHNLCDCVGNAWEWVDETSIWDNGSTAWAWQDSLGADKGQLHATDPLGLHAFICGGGWSDGVHAGARAVNLYDYPWNADSSTGSRLACDKLAG